MAQLLWANAGYSDKVPGNNERNNDASPAMGCDCVMTGQMPVWDAGAAQVCQGWQHQRYKGKNARVTRATMPAIAGNNNGVVLAMTQARVATVS
jgi:hypothetical protein